MPKPTRIPAFSLDKELKRDVDIDEEPVRFGKYKGMTPAEIANKDPNYLIWAYETFDANRKPCTRILYEACRMDKQEYENDDPDLRDMSDFFQSFN